MMDTLLVLLLLLGTAAVVAGAPAPVGVLPPPSQAAQPYQIAIESTCSDSTLVFYIKHYYQSTTDDGGTALDVSACIHQGTEAVPASWLPGTAPDDAGTATADYCISWPGAVSPGGSTLGPQTRFNGWYVTVQLEDGSLLRDNDPEEQYFNLTGHPCQPDEPNCLAWTRFENASTAWLGCPVESIVPQPPSSSGVSLPPGSPTYPIEMYNSCPKSIALSAVRWFYSLEAAPPEGSPTCRHRGQAPDGSRYCVAYWQALPAGRPGNPQYRPVVNTTVPLWYFSAYLAEDPREYFGEDLFFDLKGQPCAGFQQPGCLSWARVDSRMRELQGLLDCSGTMGGMQPPPTAEVLPEGAQGAHALPEAPPSSAMQPPPAVEDSVAGELGIYESPPQIKPAYPPSTDGGGGGSGDGGGGGGGSNAGIIAGATAGAVAAVATAAGMFFWHSKKRRRQAILDGRQSSGGRSAGTTASSTSKLMDEDELVSYIRSQLHSNQLAIHVASLAAADAAPPTAPSAAAVSLASSATSSAASGPGPTAGTVTFAAAAGIDQLAGLPPAAAVQFEELEFVRRIGEGSYGRVYLAVWRETQVAVKILLSGSSDVGATKGWAAALALDERQLRRLMEEARIMLALRHTNVLQCFGVSTFPPAIVSEYCARGSLTDVLRAARNGQEELPWRRRLEMATGAARGMLVLHASNPPIVHRDLKSPNLLVDLHWTVKVSDFNLSRIMEDAAHSQSSQVATNPRWLAPEVMRGAHATPAADVFAFGVIMWELLTWQLPWAAEGGNTWQIVGAVTAGARLLIPPADQLPGADTLGFEGLDAYIALLHRCWAQEPEERPNFRQVARELRDLLEALDGSTTGSGGTSGPSPSGSSGSPLHPA